jgi:hypothetical protein
VVASRPREGATEYLRVRLSRVGDSDSAFLLQGFGKMDALMVETPKAPLNL